MSYGLYVALRMDVFTYQNNTSSIWEIYRASILAVYT